MCCSRSTAIQSVAWNFFILSNKNKPSWFVHQSAFKSVLWEQTTEVLQMTKVHIFDDLSGEIILSGGKSIAFNSSIYGCANAAYEAALEWAKKTGIIGLDDELVMFL